MTEIEYNQLIRRQIIEVIEKKCFSEDKIVLINNTHYLDQLVSLVKNYTFSIARKENKAIHCGDVATFLNDDMIIEIIIDFGFKMEQEKKTK